MKSPMTPIVINRERTRRAGQDRTDEQEKVHVVNIVPFVKVAAFDTAKIPCIKPLSLTISPPRTVSINQLLL